MIFLTIVLQASTATASLNDMTFDLGKVGSAPDSRDVIIVTARRREDRDVVREERGHAEPLLPRAETGLIGKARIGVSAEQQALVGGAVSNRAMVTVKVPF